MFKNTYFYSYVCVDKKNNQINFAGYGTCNVRGKLTTELLEKELRLTEINFKGIEIIFISINKL